MEWGWGQRRGGTLPSWSGGWAAPLINNDADDRAVMIIILDDEKNYVEKLVINVGFGSLAGQTSSCGSFVLVYPSSSRWSQKAMMIVNLMIITSHGVGDGDGDDVDDDWRWRWWSHVGQCECVGPPPLLVGGIHRGERGTVRSAHHAQINEPLQRPKWDVNVF